MVQQRGTRFVIYLKQYFLEYLDNIFLVILYSLFAKFLVETSQILEVTE